MDEQSAVYQMCSVTSSGLHFMYENENEEQFILTLPFSKVVWTWYPDEIHSSKWLLDAGAYWDND